MPPKTKITREMIVEAAFEIAREQGAEGINARAVAERLGCSTQPVMYQFKTVEELKRAAYKRADDYHSRYISRVQGEEPMKELGLNYIRFAVEERHLFRFLFQSDGFLASSITQLPEAEELQGVLDIIAKEAELSLAQVKEVFRMLFLWVHGCASLLANNALDFDEEALAGDLDMLMYGAVAAVKGEENRYEEISR